MTETLGRLKTDLGERSTYDAVSQCSRCGYCEQACPTYVVTGEESKSGRGRNQIVRLLLEGKFKDPQNAEEALATCLLCGACTSACYAHVPTADLVLEGRRMLRGGDELPWLMRLLGMLIEDHPAVLSRLLKMSHWLKRLGISRLASRTRALRLLGLAGLEEAERHVEEAPGSFLFEALRGDPELRDASRARWAYFAPCGPNYLYPRVGLATVFILKAAAGPGVFLDNPCCGLLFYNYGDLEAARRMARRNIENYEACALAAGEADEAMEIDGSRRGLIVYGDCSSCVAHLKSYPQLFLGDPAWKVRAETFAVHVRDVVELPSLRAVRSSHDWKPEPKNDGRKSEHGRRVARSGEREVWTYHDSCRARNGQGLVAQPRRLMKNACGDAFCELPEAEWCCGGAGTFAFTQPELSEEVLKRKIGRLAQIQARAVATSSTSCLIQIARGLRKYYPECRVVHMSEVLAEELKGGASPEFIREPERAAAG